MNELITKHLAKFDYQFKHTDKNQVGYVPAFLTENIKSFLSQAITEAFNAGAKAVIDEIPNECLHYTCDERGCNNVHLKQQLTDKFINQSASAEKQQQNAL